MRVKFALARPGADRLFRCFPRPPRPPAQAPAPSSLPLLPLRRRRSRPRSHRAACRPTGPDRVVRFDRAPVPAGQRIAHRAADLPLLHPDPAEPPVRRRLGALQRGDREDAARRLQAAVGHRTSSTTCGLKTLDDAVRQRRGGQARHLPHGRAAARQDRRLHRLDQGRAHEDRREDEGAAASRSASTRSSTRRVVRAGAGHRRELHGGEGLRVRGGEIEGRAAARPARSW